MDAILKQLIDIFLKSVAGLTGLRAYLARKALEYGGQLLLDWFNDLVRKIKRQKAQEKAIDKLEEVAANPASKADEIGKAYEDMFNSGR